MNAEIATEADKDAALEQIADLKQAEPGSAEEETMLDLVSAVARYMAERRDGEVTRS
jgi:hypothetical protein